MCSTVLQEAHRTTFLVAAMPQKAHVCSCDAPDSSASRREARRARASLSCLSSVCSGGDARRRSGDTREPNASATSLSAGRGEIGRGAAAATREPTALAASLSAGRGETGLGEARLAVAGFGWEADVSGGNTL